MLQGMFHIISRLWKYLTVDTVEEIMHLVIILHNMCVKKRDAFNLCLDEEEEDG